VTDPDYSQGAKLGASLLSPTAFGLALDQLVAYENEGQGVQFSNLQVRAATRRARDGCQSSCLLLRGASAVVEWSVSGQRDLHFRRYNPLAL